MWYIWRGYAMNLKLETHGSIYVSVDLPLECLIMAGTELHMHHMRTILLV